VTPSTVNQPSFNNPTLDENVFMDSSLLFADHYKRFAKLLSDAINDASSPKRVKTRSDSASSSSLSTTTTTAQATASATSYHHHHHHHYGQNGHNHHHSHNQASNVKTTTFTRQKSLLPSPSVDRQETAVSLESLDAHLDRLACVPRSLKAICRRHILNRLVAAEKRKKTEVVVSHMPRSSSSSSSALNLPTANQHGTMGSSSSSGSNANPQIVLISNQIASLPLPKRVKNYLLYAE
jgi:hypothetical protein